MVYVDFRYFFVYNILKERRLIMNTNDRVKLLRNTLQLNQETFGEKLGIKKSAVSKIEKGENNLKDQLAKLIFKTYNLNYFWLRDGVGEMFIDLPETVIDEIKVTYHLTDKEERMIKNYLSLSKDDRSFFIDILEKLLF